MLQRKQSHDVSTAAFSVLSNQDMQEEQTSEIGKSKKKQNVPKKNKSSEGNFDKRQRISLGVNPIRVGDSTFSESEISAFTQMTTAERMIPKAVFMRLLKETVRELQPEYRVSAEAFEMLHTAVEFEITDVFFIANLLATMGGRQTVKAGHITMAAAFKKLDPNQRGVGIHSQLDFHRVMGGLGFDLSTTDLGTRLNVDWIADVGKKLLEKRKSEQADKEPTKEKQETNKKDPPKEPSKEKPKTQKKRPLEKTTTKNQPKKKLILTKKTGATPVDANKENSAPDIQ